MAHTILILGGARSGKSRQAEELALRHEGPRVYIATATADDVEMRARIAAHRARREAGEWTTVEEPLKLCAALREHSGENHFVLVDCLTLWLSNLMLAQQNIGEAIEDLAELLPALEGTICVVSNEVGLGIVPDNPLARAFRDEAGLAHQMLAQVADEVLFMVAGLPMRLK
jgi:adenosylcobinamide kinase/adenosylcobinamide-phosphate guanylyltransferase